MRKIYYLFLTMLLGMVGMTANAEEITVTLNIDNVENVKVQVNYVDKTGLVNGDNQIVLQSDNYGNYPTISVNGVDASHYVKITKTLNGVTTSFSNYIYPYASDNGAIYTIKSASEDDRTATCTITFDDPSLVQARVEGIAYNNLTFSESPYEFKYIPGFEKISFMSTQSGSLLYSVKCNDVEAEREYSYNVVNLNDETSNIVVTAKAPETEKRNVKIRYADPTNGEGFITNVTVDGEAIQNYLAADGFDVPWGASLVIQGNTDYKIEGITINDVAQNPSSYMSMNVIEDKEIVFNVRPFGNINATLTIDDINNVIVTNNVNYNDVAIDNLTNGSNEISLSENSATIAASPEGKILSVKVDDVEQTPDYYGKYSIVLTAGMNIVVTSEALVRDKTMIVYIDDIDNVAYSNCQSGNYPDYRTVQLEGGYNVISFYDGETFTISAANKNYNNAYVYLNGSRTYNSQFTPQDGDVIKLWMGGEATEYDVAFTLDNKLTAEDVTVTYDRVKTLSSLTAGLSAFAGTEVSIVANNDKVIAVKVNGAAITAVEGVFTFTVDAATTVEISDVTPTGINAINASNADNSFYTLQGVKVNGKAKGLYIKNGKKVVVNK